MVLRIALCGAEHWHLPLYIAAYREAGCEVVAYSLGTPTEAPGTAFPAARRYDDDGTMFDRETVDFAFVFGRHDSMLGRCRTAVERGIPFSVEKPVTLDLGQLARLRDAADAKGLFASVALPYRVSEIGQVFATAKGTPLHLGIRNLAGPIQRYLKNGNPWMLQQAAALGGAMINLAPHFIDLAHWIAKSPVWSIHGTRLRYTPGNEVEEYGSVTITYESGFIAQVECGYTFPSSVEYSTEHNREFYISLATTTDYLMATNDVLTSVARVGGASGLDTMFRASRNERPLDLQTDHFFHPYVVETLARFRAGGKPVAGLNELVAVNDVLSRWDASAAWAGEPPK